MERIKVKDLMVPLDQYVCVSQDDTLFEAVVELEQAQAKVHVQGVSPQSSARLRQRRQSRRKAGLFGRCRRALEPRYSELTDMKKVSGFGLSSDFMKSMMNRYELWKAPLEDLCHKAAQVQLGSIVSAPLEGEVIDQNATLDKAVHQMIMGHHQSLLVTSDGSIVGILRLTDVFKEVSDRIKACKI